MNEWERYPSPGIDRIYFDMDDTIADLSGGLQKLCGISPVPQELSTPGQDDAMWSAIRSIDHFYLRLKKCAYGMELLERFRYVFGSKVELLTAVPRTGQGIVSAAEDRLRWVRKHVGDDIVVNIVHSAEEKLAFAGAGRFLIDGLKQDIQQWETAGGTGILFLKDDTRSTDAALYASALQYALELRKNLSCPDCGAYAAARQRYCEICGADIRSQGGPRVNYEEMMCLYGPPPAMAEATCPNCKTSWTAYRDFRNESVRRFCRKCGTCIDNLEFKGLYD